MATRPSIEQRHELPVTSQIVDARPMGDRFGEWLTDKGNFYAATLPVAILTAAAPVLGLITLPYLAFCAAAHLWRASPLPVRHPMGSKDDTGKPGSGILYVGEVASKSQFENFKEIWLSDDDLRKHMLILGSTGSGKSEALKSIFYNALNWSSGFFIADGKADNKLPTDVYTMVRANGRDADMLVLNFLLAGKTPEQVRTSRTRRSNKLNPFPAADADTIIQMGANLLPKAEGDSKNWQEKALNLWRSLVAALCYKRDTQGMELSVATFIDYMSLEKVEELYLEGHDEARHREGQWSYGYAGIKNYLESGCPAYQTQKLLAKHGRNDPMAPLPPARGKDDKRATGKVGKEFDQDSMASEQHAYRTNQLMPVLNLLDKTYGFIFRDKFSEIDMTDVTLRNRVLVMLIPSLEKSAAEAENLGKLAIACLRVMMSKNLGAEVEGGHEDLLGSKATNSPYPYIVALDELAYYFSDGIAVMFAQARSLGTCMIAAAQDLEKLTEGSKSAEAGAMLANQVTKFFMRIDDTGKTAEMVQKVVGKAWVAARRSFRYNQMGYARKTDVDLVETDRVPTQALQSFGQGEGIVNALGKTHFMRWFYMGRDIEKHRVASYHINRFLQVAAPTQDQLVAHSMAVDEFNDPFRKGQRLMRLLNQQEEIHLVVDRSPVIEALELTERSLGEHASAEEKAIRLYLSARAALRQAQTGAQLSSGVRTGQNSDKPARPIPDAQAASPVPTGAAQAGVDPDEDDDDNVLLDFLSLTPLQRRLAEDVMGLRDSDATVPALAPAPSSPADSAAQTDALMRSVLADPFATLVTNGRTMRLGEGELLTGHLLRQIIGAPEVINPDTGLVLEHKDDWIGAALAEALEILDSPRSPDNTVVGFNDPTLEKIEQVERFMDSPAPKAGAMALQKIIAVRVTPDTVPTDPDTDEAQFESLLQMMQEKIQH